MVLNREISALRNDNLPDRIRMTAVYGRVSTEHEAQLSALENQKKWYDTIIAQHPNWRVVNRYFDEGVTGTSTSKRPAFVQMLEDARAGQFDLIVTREVCRFARNTVSALTVVRELQHLNVEVYFVQDNIWTLDGDGELRLTIMATLAQEESRKISERVLAGQKISRNEKVIYGTGNILGYDRSGKTYVINAEQAHIVKMIYELYADGYGYQRISNILVSLGFKNTKGEIRWDATRIGRILKNATYKGYITYNKSHSDGYLTQRRINHREEDYICIKGDFEPIVSEELWQICADIRAKRSTHCIGEDGKKIKFGRNEPRSVWSDKLRCSCGSAFRRFKWRANQNGKEIYGFQCYRQSRNVRAKYYRQHGLDATAVCESKSIPSWHIDLMARMVFRIVWQDRKDAVLLACQMLEECATDNVEMLSVSLADHEKKLEKLNRSLEGLRRMRSLDEITYEEFATDTVCIKQEIQEIQLQIEEMKNLNRQKTLHTQLDMDSIKDTLNQWIDLTIPVIPDEVIDQFLLQVVLIDDDTFNFTLDLSAKNAFEDRLKPSQIAFKLYHQNKNASKCPIDVKLSRHISDPQDIYTFTVTADDAENYCKEIGMRFFRKKWRDHTVIISI